MGSRWAVRPGCPRSTTGETRLSSSRTSRDSAAADASHHRYGPAPPRICNRDFSQTFNSAGQQVIVSNPFSVHNGPAGTPIRDPFAGNVIPQNIFDPVGKQFASNQRLWALPNGPGAPFTHVGNYSSSAVQPNDEDQVVTRMDHTIGSKWKLFGTYAAQSIALGGFDPFHNGTDFLTVGGNESDLTQTAVIGATALFSPM